MVLQEEELYEFSRNMSMSTGKGPSDAICKARWRVKQLYIAKDFVEIFNDIEAVILEAEEVNEPTSYQPKRWASFKPPKDDKSKKNVTTKKVPNSKKKTWSHERSKSKEFDDDVLREVEERPNTPDVVEQHNMEDGEEVDENGNNEEVNIGSNATGRGKNAVECVQKKMGRISLEQNRNKVKTKMAKRRQKVYLKELLTL